MTEPSPQPTPAPRLLLFTELYRPWIGGSVRWLEEIARHWPAPVRVLCGLRPDGSVQPTDNDGPAPVRRLRLRLTNWGPDTVGRLAQYACATAHLIRECRRGDVDLVLCGRGVPEGFIANLAGCVTGVPYATLVHGEEVVACGTSGLLRRMLRRSYAGARAVICNSHNSARLAQEAGACEGALLVSHPGVDVARWRDFLSRQLPKNPHPITLLTVGRFDARKNHAGVLEALRRLREEGLDLRYVAAGVGDGLAGLQARADALGVSQAVTWLAGASDEMIQRAFAQADIFVMPAVHTGTDIEGFGIVYLEAALAGVPSVAGEAGGAAEAVLHERTGLVVDGRDTAALAAALARLARDAEFRIALGQAARRRARANFDWPVLIDDLAGRLGRMMT